MLPVYQGNLPGFARNFHIPGIERSSWSYSDGLLRYLSSKSMVDKGPWTKSIGEGFNQETTLSHSIKDPSSRYLYTEAFSPFWPWPCGYQELNAVIVYIS